MNSLKKLKVLVINERTFVRTMFKKTLRGCFNSVEEASSEQECIRLTPTLKPDIFIFGGIQTLHDSMLQTFKTIKEKLPQSKILLWLDTPNKTPLLEHILAGADGYIPNHWTEKELLMAIRHLQQGKYIVPRDFTDSILQEIKEKIPLKEIRPSLTKRELEVLKCLKDGLNNKDIGGKICMSEATVKVHIHDICQKLGVSNRMQAVIKALDSHIISNQV